MQMKIENEFFFKYLFMKYLADYLLPESKVLQELLSCIDQVPVVLVVASTIH